jgi:sugar lactone lactonase YvrE
MGRNAPEHGEAGPRWRTVEAAHVERLGRSLPGPEDVAFSPDAALHTGLSDGRIVRVEADGSATTLADTHGRPLGLRFHPTGSLIIADASSGLLAMRPDGAVRTLMRPDQPDGHHFVNAVAIASNHDLYFTISSTRFTLERMMGTALTREATGKLMHYDWRRGVARTVAEGISFANGVALSGDETRAFVAETFDYRIRAIDLTVTRPAPIETLIDALPGFPDNLSRDETGAIWCALFSRPVAALDRLRAMPRLARLLAGMTGGRSLVPSPRVGRFIAFDDAGAITGRAMLEKGDALYAPITTVRRWGDHVYLASLEQTTLARLPLDVVRDSETPAALERERAAV